MPSLNIAKSPPFDFYVAGVQHRPHSDVAEAVEYIRQYIDLDKVVVTLVGEPSNMYDRYAVKVLINGSHIGYVPKPSNIDVWSQRDLGFKPVARLLSFHSENPLYKMFRVQVSYQ